jgi:N-acetylmuramoyl-L-alanine amidase
MVILLDAGHGGIIDGKYQTKGKRSPVWEDGTQYFEGAGNRLIVASLRKMLHVHGIKYEIITPEESDIPLSTRVARANAYCKKYGSKGCLYVSIHSNGFKQESAHGWSVYTTKGETMSDIYATALYEEAEKMWANEKFRKDTKDGDPDKEANFYVIKHTRCAAILSENFFMTNERECKKYLLSAEGRKQIAMVHFNMIKRFI